jgi:AraC-like DNA-binding protein/mannose-6-phosphate isomerase-like protein (cupin superfamily)
MDLQKRSKPAEVNFPEFGIYALESHHGEAFRMEVIQHDFAKFLFVIDGRGELEVGDHSYDLSSETPVYIPAGISHRIIDRLGKPLSLYAVCIEMESMPVSIRQRMEALPLTMVRARYHTLHWHERFRQLLYEQMMQRTDRSIIILEIVLWMLLQISRYKPADAEVESSVDRIRSYTQDMAHDFYREQSLAEAAAKTGMGERRFSQLFREINGCSWLNHLRELRIEHACLLLKETDHSPTAIAYECGFSDLSNFYRAFKKKTNQAPLEYRSV